MVLSDERKSRLVNEIKFSATRSSGPGGQNVNKLNTKVELRFSISKSDVFSADERKRLFVKLNNRINAEDELVLTSQAERSQSANKEKVVELFISLLEKGLTIPKSRKKTLPTAGSRIKRLESKKLTALKKQFRKPPEI